MEEFVVDVHFELGVPLIVLDIVSAFTGLDLAGSVREEFEPKQTI